MDHKTLKRLQLNNLPVFTTHPRVVLVDVIALHSHSPLHQRYLSEEPCFRFLSLIGFKKEKVISCFFSHSFQALKRSDADPGLIHIPFAFGTFTTWGCCVATTIHQFTTRSCWKVGSCKNDERDQPCSPSCTIGSTAFVLLGASVAPEIVFGFVASTLYSALSSGIWSPPVEGADPFGIHKNMMIMIFMNLPIMIGKHFLKNIAQPWQPMVFFSISTCPPCSEGIYTWTCVSGEDSEFRK